MYTMKNVKVLKNFPTIAKVVVNQLRAVKDMREITNMYIIQGEIR